VVDTDKKKPLSWVASGSSEAGKAVAEWVAEPESKKEMWGRAGWVALGGVVGAAMIHDMGWQGVVIDAGVVLGGAAWMHFSPKAKVRSAQRNEQVSEGAEGVVDAPQEDSSGAGPVQGAEGQVSQAWTPDRATIGHPVTCDDGSGDLEDAPTVRLDSPHLSRSGVQAEGAGPDGGQWPGVHAGQSLGDVDLSKRPTVGHPTNQDDQGEWVSQAWTVGASEGHLPSSEGVQELDEPAPDWFITYIRRHEEIQAPREPEESAHIPLPTDPFDASAMVKEQPPLWTEEDESTQVTDHVPGEDSRSAESYQELLDKQAREREKQQDAMLMDHLLNGLSVRDLAEKYEMAPSTVQNWLMKAKARSQERLKSLQKTAAMSGNGEQEES